MIYSIDQLLFKNLKKGNRFIGQKNQKLKEKTYFLKIC